jgi:hypothetical protein
MIRALRVGVPTGIAAGFIFAVWSMAAMWVTGAGLWLPLNLIAHTFYKAAPLDGTFSAPAMVTGLAVHMTVATIFGTATVLVAGVLPGRRSLVIAGAVMFVAVVWPIMQYGVWYSLDERAAEGFNDWIFAGAHLIFGLTAAGIAAVTVADDDTLGRGRHAVGRTAEQFDPPAGNLFMPERRG